jgi:lysophospholipase L1-like esterase
MSHRTKKLAANLVIFLGSLLFSWLICEALIRVFYGDPAQKLGHHQLFMEYDSLLGWRKIPNITGKHVTSEYSISEHMNSKGIRGPEYSYERRNHEYKILVLGDSFAEGYTVEFRELFSEILKRKLNNNSNGKYYEVINAGAGGYSTDQELLFFQDEGKKYTPDLTILMFYDNDVWFNNQPKYWRGYKPLFQLNGDGTLRLTNVPVPKPDPAPLQSPPKRNFWKNPRDAIDNWLSKKSYTYRFVQDRIENTAYLHKIAMKIGLVEAPIENKDDVGIIPIPKEFRVYQKESHTDTTEAWKITEALLVKLKEESAAIGSELLIFYVPVRASIYLNEWERMKKQYGISDDHWAIEQIRNDLMAVCQRNHLDCIDPVEAFRAEAGRLQTKEKRLYFISDGHWTASGHAFVGELLAQYIGSTYASRWPAGR